MSRVGLSEHDRVGVVIVDHGSRKEKSNRRLLDVVNWFGARTDFEIVEGAHLEVLEPTIEQAFSSCVEQGATFVVVAPFMLLPGKHSTIDIPAQANSAAEKHQGIRFVVTEPLGVNQAIIEVMQSQIEKSLDRQF